MTPHNHAEKKDISKTVLMVGDPKRAQWIAKTFLKNAKLVNDVRCAYAYTGTYRSQKITIMAHGMGIPSIGIYSYELFKFYGVQNIIRMGTCGSFVKEADIGSLIIAESAFSFSPYAKEIGVEVKDNVLYATKSLVDKAKAMALQLSIPVLTGRISTHDAFYSIRTLKDELTITKNPLGVEMEAFGLYANAKKLKRKALTILTVSDSYITHKKMNPIERETTLKQMATLGLNLALSL